MDIETGFATADLGCFTPRGVASDMAAEAQAMTGIGEVMILVLL